MIFLKRIFFFVLINVAIIAVLTTVTSVFGINTYYLEPNGLNLQSLAVFSLIIGFAGSFISLLISKWMAKSMMGVEVIKNPTNDEESFLITKIQQFAQQGGVNMPEVGIYESGEVNAFATGWSKNRALVAVSRGLLQQMNREEVEGVLAHEMAHVVNGDMVTMALIQGVVNTFVIFAARVAAYAVQTFLAKGEENSAIGGLSYWLTALLFEILFGILASIVVMSFSRWREYRADFGGAQFVGKQKMIAALKRLQSSTNQIDNNQKSLATMKMSGKGGITALFSTHPSLEKRIESLQKALIQ